MFFLGLLAKIHYHLSLPKQISDKRLYPYPSRFKFLLLCIQSSSIYTDVKFWTQFVYVSQINVHVDSLLPICSGIKNVCSIKTLDTPPSSPYIRQGLIGIDKRSSSHDLYIYIQSKYKPIYHIHAFIYFMIVLTIQ